jgi:hypothetical protein
MLKEDEHERQRTTCPECPQALTIMLRCDGRGWNPSIHRQSFFSDGVDGCNTLSAE